jgi:RNA polymerase sigma-B factor
LVVVQPANVPSRSDRIAQTNALLDQLSAHPADHDLQEIQDRLVRLNMVVAREIARRYQGRGIDADDLEQVAYVGLVKAVRNYDPEKATDFLSFAVPTVRGELRRWFRDGGWTVRPPRSVQELQAKVTATQDELVHRLGRPARPDEIAEVLGVELDAVESAMSANGCFSPTSLDAPSEHDPDGNGLGARLGGEDPGFARAEARVALRPLMRTLSERERTMIEMRFYRGATQAEIGEEIGVTQMQVSRLLSSLMTRLRSELTGELAGTRESQLTAA